MRVLRSNFIRADERPFHIDAHERCGVICILVFGGASRDSCKLFLRIGHGRRAIRRHATRCLVTADGIDRLVRTVAKIVADGTVGMHVDQAGNDIASTGVDVLNVSTVRQILDDATVAHKQGFFFEGFTSENLAACDSQHVQNALLSHAYRAIIQNEAAEPFGSLVKARIYAAYSAIPQKPRNVRRRSSCFAASRATYPANMPLSRLLSPSARRLAAATALVVVVVTAAARTFSDFLTCRKRSFVDNGDGIGMELQD